MTKPLAMVAHLGPNKKMACATSLVTTEFAAMARFMEERGYEVCYGRTDEEPQYRNCPMTGLKPWDGVTQPDVVFLHQAPHSTPGGRSQECHARLTVLAEVLPKAQQVLRLVVDNNGPMTFKRLLAQIRTRARRTIFDGWREEGPCPLAKQIRESLISHAENGTYKELGYEAARSQDAETPFEHVGVFSRQLLLCRELFPEMPEKDLDFVCAGTSRGNKKLTEARLAKFPDGLLEHESASWMGSLFGSKRPRLFPEVWHDMCRAKGHVVMREPNMAQLPLHRYLQALVCNAVPIVVGEPEEVPFIHHPELQKILRVSTYAEAQFLIDQFEALTPLLEQELAYWLEFDRSHKVL